jgi:hypothetical protein
LVYDVKSNPLKNARQLHQKSLVNILGTLRHWHEVKTHYDIALYSEKIIFEDISAQGRYAKGVFVIYPAFPRLRSPPFLLGFYLQNQDFTEVYK